MLPYSDNLQKEMRSPVFRHRPGKRGSKILYAGLFIVIIPIALWFWAKSTEQIIRYPAIESETAGRIFTMGGGFLGLWGMFALIKYGKGLPMNAFPPTDFVKKGPYRLLQHPIYWGFGMLMAGISILKGSASGLWLVTPVTILCMIDLVWGYEKIDLKKRFPDETLKTAFRLPETDAGPISMRDRLASLFWIVVLLTLGNYLSINLPGNPPPLTGKPLNIHLIFENPDLQILSLIFIFTVPFFLKKKAFLSEWAVSGILSLSLSVFIALIFPEIGAQYFLIANPDTGSGWTSFFFTVPVFLTLISLKAIYRQSLRWSIFFSLIAILAAVIQLSNSRSCILHLLTSLVIFLLAANYNRVWILLRNSAEKTANSWHEWSFGKVRVINHGYYVGFGTFLGLLVAGILTGIEYAWAILASALILIIFSALWAQIIEGSEKLKRPFGFYGALVGIIFASLVDWAMGWNAWVIIGVGSAIMPWVQAVGRMRCLVNGCCHGRVVDDPKIGIRYFHPRSRVCGLSGLNGELLHPTQLYAILWLFFVGFVLLSLWNNRFPPPFIFGLYLILTGVGRFVEEAYRGEPQTPVLKGLRLYQWTAILSIVVGAVMTTIPAEPVIVTPGFGWETLVVALLGGLFTFFAMGVDFPYSNKRFSRLV